MAAFRKGAAIHDPDSIYDILVRIVHFLPSIGSILGILADRGEQIIAGAIPGRNPAEISLPDTVERLICPVIVACLQSQHRNILIVIGQCIATIFCRSRLIMAEIFPALRCEHIKIIRLCKINTLRVDQIRRCNQLIGSSFCCVIIVVRRRQNEKSECIIIRLADERVDVSRILIECCLIVKAGGRIGGD